MEQDKTQTLYVHPVWDLFYTIVWDLIIVSLINSVIGKSST